MTKKKVTIRYERDVLVGSESRQLYDVLNDISKLSDGSDVGRAYKRSYGVASPAARKDVSDTVAADGSAMLTKDGAVTTTEALASKANLLVSEGKLHPVRDGMTTRPYAASDFEMTDKGEWKQINVVPKGNLVDQVDISAADILRSSDMIGSVPTVVSKADLAAFESLERSAAALGVSASELADYGTATSPKTGGTISVSWSVDASGEEEVVALDAAGDPLRDRAYRPGGHNSDQDVLRYGPALFKNESAHASKKDNYAVLRVISGFSPSVGDLLNTNQDFKVQFQSNRFLIDNAQEGQAERVALIETFGETYLYAFGERPKMYSYSGVLLDTEGLNWLNEWRHAYRTRLRATSTLKMKARVFLVYRDVAREGVIVSTINAQNAVELGVGRFSFQMFVLREYFLDGLPNIDLQLPSSVDFLAKSSSDESKAIEDNYDIRFEDITGQELVKSALAPSAQSAIDAESAIVARRRAQIEESIKAMAFKNGKLVQRYGNLNGIDVPASELFGAPSSTPKDSTWVKPQLVGGDPSLGRATTLVSNE